MLLNTLSYIGEKLNNNNINWAVGGSILLNHYNLINVIHDIDLLIDCKDIEKADMILSNLGFKKTKDKNSNYSTKYFYEYIIKNVDVDVMAGFTINHSLGKYEYILDLKAITNFKYINNVKIPLTALEDWYILYQLIPGREYKVNLIEKYLINNGSKNYFLLKRALNKSLPDNIKNKAMNLLNKIEKN